MRCRIIRIGAAFIAAWIGLMSAASAGAVYNGREVITVTGMSNSLSTIAQDVDNADVFAYDPQTRTALSRAGLVVEKEAELIIGRKGEPEAGETLRIVCSPDAERNSLNLDVEGILNLYHSRVEGVNSRIRRKRYRFVGVYYRSLGGGEVINSDIRGAAVGLAVWSRYGRRVTVRDVTVSDCTTGLRWSVSNMDNVTVDGLDVSGAHLGALLETPRTRSAPIVMRNLVFGTSALRISTIKGPGGTLVLCVNTKLDPARVHIRDNPEANRVLLAQTQYLKVVNRDDQPLPDVGLRLSSTGPDGKLVLPPIRVQTDGAGDTWLDVPVQLLVQAESGPGDSRVLAVRNRLDVATDGDAYVVLKDAWSPTASEGRQFARLQRDTWREDSIPFQPRPETGPRRGIVNLCHNGGFEAESIRGFADCWWAWQFYEMKPGGWGMTSHMNKDDPLVQYGIDHTMCVQGEKSLALPPNLYVLHSAMNGLAVFKKGKDYAVSFSARSDQPDSEFLVGVAFDRRVFKVGTEWTRFEAVYKDLPQSCRLMMANRPTVSNDTNQTNRLWIDAVQVEEGTEPHDFVPDNYTPVEY